MVVERKLATQQHIRRVTTAVVVIHQATVTVHTIQISMVAAAAIQVVMVILAVTIKVIPITQVTTRVIIPVTQLTHHQLVVITFTQAISMVV